MRSIELTLDEETDAAVRADWGTLLEAGLPSQARHTGESNRPHITIGAGTGFPFGDGPEGSVDLDPASARAIRLDYITESFRALPLEARFSGLIVFGAPPKGLVLSRLVTLSSELLALHADVHERAPGATELTRPGAWTPHVTLAHRMRPDQLAEAVSLLGPMTPGRAIGARLWDSTTRQISILA